MARPTKNEDGPQVRRTYSIPRDVDSEISSYSEAHEDTKSGAIVKAWKFFSGSNNKNDSCETQGKQNGR
jgi:hypothetical protein